MTGQELKGIMETVLPDSVLQRLRDYQRFGVGIVMRLKENWKPKVQRIVRGDVSRTFLPGTELDVVLTDEVLTLGNAIDADVTVGPERIPCACAASSTTSPLVGCEAGRLIPHYAEPGDERSVLDTRAGVLSTLSLHRISH